jgi:hypothetical protein
MMQHLLFRVLHPARAVWFVTREGGTIIHLLSDKDGYTRTLKCCEKAETGWRMLVLWGWGGWVRNAMCEVEKLISDKLRGCWGSYCEGATLTQPSPRVSHRFIHSYVPCPVTSTPIRSTPFNNSLVRSHVHSLPAHSLHATKSLTSTLTLISPPIHSPAQPPLIYPTSLSHPLIHSPIISLPLSLTPHH